MSGTWATYKPPLAGGAPDAAGRGRGGSGALHEDEAQLWRRWRVEHDPAARQALVERYAPYAQRLAARIYARRTDPSVEFADYRQLGMVGLLESVERYVPGGAAQFHTFATPRIQGAILSGLERLSERQQQTAARRRLRSERLSSLASAPFSNDPQRLLRELADVGVALALGFILEGTGMCVDPVNACQPDAYAHVELRRTREQLWSLVTRLPERDRRLLELHYGEGVAFEEIAARWSVTKGRVAQLHRRAILRVRELVRCQERCDATF